MKENYLTTYYIGLNDKDKHVQLYETQTMIRIICGCLKKHAVNNYTYSTVIGCYKGTLETTIKLELFNDKLTSDCIVDLEEVLNQECIAEVVTDCTAINFILKQRS